jgi:hypothetical protein
MQEIIIDEEFQRLFPPLDEQEFCKLEENILTYGCMNPLVLWEGILIDGHNRYNIVTKHNLPFNTISLEFKSRDEVIAWMIRVQIDRRNLTPMQLTYYRGMHYNIEKKMHGDADRITKSSPSGQNVHLEGSTANRLSEQYRVTSRTIRRDALISDVIIAIGLESEEAKHSILSGETRISRKQLREMSSEPEEHIAKTASKIASGTFKEKPTSTATGAPDHTAGNHPLTADIINDTNNFISRIKTIESIKNPKELKKAMRTHIDTLEELYKRI